MKKSTIIRNATATTATAAARRKASFCRLSIEKAARAENYLVSRAFRQVRRRLPKIRKDFIVNQRVNDGDILHVFSVKNGKVETMKHYEFWNFVMDCKKAEKERKTEAKAEKAFRKAIEKKVSDGKISCVYANTLLKTTSQTIAERNRHFEKKQAERAKAFNSGKAVEIDVLTIENKAFKIHYDKVDSNDTLNALFNNKVHLAIASAMVRKKAFRIYETKNGVKTVYNPTLEKVGNGENLPVNIEDIAQEISVIFWNWYDNGEIGVVDGQMVFYGDRDEQKEFWGEIFRAIERTVYVDTRNEKRCKSLQVVCYDENGNEKEINVSRISGSQAMSLDEIMNVKWNIEYFGWWLVNTKADEIKKKVLTRYLIILGNKFPEGCKNKEIAEMIGVSEMTISRDMKELLKLYKEYNEL